MVRGALRRHVASRSCLVMRPPAPVPFTWLRSMLYSRAILRTSGDKRTSGRLGFHGRRGFFHGNRIRTRGVRHGFRQRRRLGSRASSRPEALRRGAWVRAGAAAVGRSFRGRGRWSRRAVARAFVDPAHHGADRHRLAFFHQHFSQNAGGGRRNLGVHFVGRNLKQRLVALHVLPGFFSHLVRVLRRCFRPSGASRRQS